MAFLAAAFLLLAASTTPARPAGLQGAPAPVLAALPARPAGLQGAPTPACFVFSAVTALPAGLQGAPTPACFVLAAASPVPARSAGLHGAPTPACFVLAAASTVTARPAGLHLASQGEPTPPYGAGSAASSYVANYGFVLAGAFAVLAPAASLQLASRAAHRQVAGCLVLLAAFALHARGVVGSDVHPYTDENSMHAIATALGADRLLGWTNNTIPCLDGWYGVTCNRDGRVSMIRARYIGLNGTLAPDIALLTGLRDLDLRGNSISGDFPSATFLDIERLRLDGNDFTSVPHDLLSISRALVVFSISDNPRLQSWELPNDSSRLDTLQAYTADNAQLSGTISDFLATNDFPALSVLSLANNSLDGEVPARFASPSLTQLDLSNNRLTGPIDFLANLRGLQVLRLTGNAFTGPLPDFSGHWNLLLVDLAHNRLTGVVPASLVGLPSLEEIQIKGNLLQGAQPEFAGSVRTDIAEAAQDGSCFCRTEPGRCDRQVETLIAIARSFGFPAAFASSWKGNRACNNWLGVHCDKNGAINGLNFCRLGLNGTLNPAFGDLKALLMLSLAGNNLTGEVPWRIASLPSLKLLDISDNALQGTMPRLRSSVTIWAGGNTNLTVAGASRLCISGALAAALAMAMVVLLLA